MDELDNPELAASSPPRLDQGVPQSDGNLESAIDELPAYSEDDAQGHAAQVRGPGQLSIETDVGSFMGQAHLIPSQNIELSRSAFALRPGLSRNSSNPELAPDYQSPNPVDSPDASQDPPDSLTLADLKRLRSEFPVTQTLKQELPDLASFYTFEYNDAQPFSSEINDWFEYSEDERRRLFDIAAVHDASWGRYTSTSPGDQNLPWTDSQENRLAYMQSCIEQISTEDHENGTAALQSLGYLALGNWKETAGQEDSQPFAALINDDQAARQVEAKKYSSFQMSWMINNTCAAVRLGLLSALLPTLQKVIDRDLTDSLNQIDGDITAAREYDATKVSVDLWCLFTIVYVVLECVRMGGDTVEAKELRAETYKYHQLLLQLFTETTARLRWDEAAPIPQSKLALLLWKCVLLTFGGTKDVDKLKSCLENPIDEKRDQTHITASPLDYHLFRQEISSKYPAYKPPRPLFDFEPENNTMLPPLKRKRPGADSAEQALPESVTRGINSNSIMHQPVHIATPAPSPPPSPAAVGKGVKKQNYQTNQMFPFLYPPLDTSSNNLGGKGSTELQDALAGRTWQGSDIPASILEAAELFAKRMRATRSMKQLWEARVDYMKCERGWRENGVGDASKDDDDGEFRKPESPPAQISSDRTDAQRLLDSIEVYYRQSLPHLQSVIVVLLKAVLKNVSTLVAFAGESNESRSAVLQDQSATSDHSHTLSGSVNGPVRSPPGRGFYAEGEQIRYHVGLGRTFSAEEENTTRTNEVSAKALSATLLLLLKWFKVSHVLRYEYLTQLLLDANYVPLVLKLWQTQDIGRMCHFSIDREELSFFGFCRSESANPAVPTQQGNVGKAESSDSSSSDDAAPPPIRTQPQPQPQGQGQSHPNSAVSEPVMTDYTVDPPEIDELGYQTTRPSLGSPLEEYCWRNMFATINYMRILQKITHRKAHRSLLLVSYKSSVHLKKILRVPLEMLRYYTLKVLKNQVPYCGRKWRQSNMRIITAVWLSVPAELRDDWLSGGGGGMGGAGPGDIDGTVEEALPLEQSLRSLTHWWNVRHYPREMGVERGLVQEEQTFFERELEKLEPLLVADSAVVAASDGAARPGIDAA